MNFCRSRSFTVHLHSRSEPCLRFHGLVPTHPRLPRLHLPPLDLYWILLWLYRLWFSQLALERYSYSFLQYQSTDQLPIFSVMWVSHPHCWVIFWYLASQIPTGLLYLSIYSEEIFLRNCKEFFCCCARFGWICSQSKFAAFLAYQETIVSKLLFQLRVLC